MLGDFLETIGSLGVLASVMVHYKVSVSSRGEALAEEAGVCVGGSDARCAGAGTSSKHNRRDCASDG